MPQQLAQQRGVLGADAALQRPPQRRQLGPQATLGQHRRVVGSCDQAVPHRPAGDAQHVGGDRAQRDPASSKTCCSRWASRVRSQSSALRSRVRSRSSRIGWWHQPGSDQAVGDQLADRHRGGHIGLGAGHGAQVGGLQQPAPAVVFQQDRQRPPGHPGGSIPTTVTPSWPSSHPAAPARPWSPEPTVSAAADPRRVGDPDRGGDAGLVHLQTGAPLDEQLHGGALPGSATALPPGGASSCSI